jgi:hypothetical protein
MASRSHWTELIIPNGGLNEAEQPQTIKDNQWTAAADVEPMIDGVRRRKGSALSNPVALRDIAQDYDLGTDDREFADGTSEYIAQRVTPSSTLQVFQVAVQLKINSGLPTGNVNVALVAEDASDDPDLTAAVTNGDFTDFSSLDSATITDEYYWYQFRTDDAAILTKDTNYWFVIRHVGAGSTGTDTIDIREESTGGGQASTAPDALQSVSDVEIWFDANDVPTGGGDGNNTGATALPEKTGNYAGGWVEPASTNGVILHTAAGANPINGHAWVAQAGTPCNLTLSGAGAPAASQKYATTVDWTFFCVYKPGTNGPAANWCLGQDKSVVGDERGVAVPLQSADGAFLAYSDTADDSMSNSIDTNNTDVKIGIVVRDSSDDLVAYGTDSSGDLSYFGTVNNTGEFIFDGFMRADDGTDAEANFGIAEMIVFDGEISAAERSELYQWAALKYGLAPLSGGASTADAGYVKYSTDGAAWIAVASADLNYRLYSGEARIRAIADYNLSDGSAQRHLVWAGEELYKNVSGTMTMVSTRKQVKFAFRHPSTGGTEVTDILPSWAIGNDIFFFTPAGGFSWKFYIRDGVEYFEEEGLRAPTNALTLGTGAGNALPDGTYYVDYYFYNADLGIQGSRKYQGVSAASQATSTQHITVTNIPTATSDAGERATHIRFELKEVGSSIFRLVREVALGPENGKHDGAANAAALTDTTKNWDVNYWVGATVTNNTDASSGVITANTATTVTATLSGGTDDDWDVDDTYTIAIGDIVIDSTHLPTTIEAEYNHTKPPVHMVRCVAENRQFLGNIIDTSAPNGVGYSGRVRFSAINGITPHYESYPANNYRTFGLGDSDYVTALLFLPPRLLIVGMRNSIWAIDARKPATSDKLRISETVGIAHHSSAIVHSGTLYLLSDSPHARGFYRWRPGEAEPERIRGADRTLALMEVDQFKYSSMVIKPVDADRSQIIWTATQEDGTEHDRLFVYDTALDAMTIWRRQATQEANVLGVIEESGKSKIYAGSYRGKEYELDTTDDDDDGLGFTGSFTTKAIDGGAPWIKKRLRGLGAVYTADDVIDISVEPDYGEESSVTDSETLSAESSTRIKRSRIATAGQTFKATFSGADPWYIRGFSADLQGTGDD